MRVLLTNDDGVTAPGLLRLAEAVQRAGHDLMIAAPLREASGAGAGVGPVHTMGDGIVVERPVLPGLEEVTTFGIDALPALIVLAACIGAFGPEPDIIVSGINPGRNVGRAALHSGTVGAALTGVHFNKRALAVSIQSGPFSGFESATGVIHFETAGEVATQLLPILAAAPPRTVLNCNVPNLATPQLRGIRRAHLSRTGLVRSAVINEREGSRMQLELGFVTPQPGDETDEALSSRGYVTITPLASVAEDMRKDVASIVETAVIEAANALRLDAGGDAADEGPAA